MAEDNPKLELKTPAKPINNCREVYLAENEKNILGARGFKFALGNDFSKKLKILDRIKNSEINNNINSKLNIDNKILPEISNYNKPRLIKSKSLININNNPKINFITSRENNNNYDTNVLTPKIPIHINTNKNTSIDIPFNNKYIISSFSSPKSIKNKTNFSGDFNLDINSSNLRKNFIFKKTKSSSTHHIKRNIPDIKIKKFNKLHKFYGLKKIINKKDNIKSYFKGVESVFIYPEQIYGALNDYNKNNDKKNSFDAYESNIKEKIEQNNEFKEDQKSLLFEEKAKENLINSKDFYNYLINREYFYQTQIDKEKDIFKEKNSSNEEKEDFKNKMNYLKRIAFSKENNFNRNSIIGITKENIDNNETNSTKNEENAFYKKKPEEENIEKVRIDGKIYVLKSQMEQIARKILNKCKVYNDNK